MGTPVLASIATLLVSAPLTAQKADWGSIELGLILQAPAATSALRVCAT